MVITAFPTPARDFTVFDEPFGDEPNEETAYLLVHETDAGDGGMNNLSTTQLLDVDIVGKRLIIEQGADNHLHLYNDKKNLKHVRFYAETLEIRSPFHLPQTTVEIYARHLIFVGDGVLSTVPDSITVIPDAATYHTDAGTAKDGLSGGSASVFAEDVAPLDGPPRFIIRGGNGQQAGPGKSAQPGANMPALRTDWEGDRWFIPGSLAASRPPPDDPDYHSRIVFFQDSQLTLGQNKFPGHGTNGKPGSKPGEGGTGGEFRSNLQIAAIVDNAGGIAGKPWPDDPKPGAPGQPNPAYHMVIPNFTPPNDPRTLQRQFQNTGQPAKSPSANKAQGDKGAINVISDSAIEWVHPCNVEVVLRYAEDLYLSRRHDKARLILDDYADKVSVAIAAHRDEDGLVSEFDILARRIERLRTQLALQLDYYGQPPAWVPLLSLEVYEDVFQADVLRAADALYLATWFGRKMDKAILQAAVLRRTVNTARQQLESDVAQLNDLRARQLPALENDLDQITRDQAFLIQQLQLREQELLTQATATADELRRKNEEAANLRMFGTIISLIPVAQPAPAIIGSALISIANRDDFWTAASKMGSAYGAGQDYQDEFGDLLGGLQGLDFTSDDAFDKSLKAVAPGQKSTNGTRIKGAIKAIYQRANDQLSTKAQQSVPADLAGQIFEQLKKSDHDYNELIARGEALNRKKQDTFARLEETQQLAARTVEDIARHLHVLETATEKLRNTETAINLHVRSMAIDLRREAEQRLRYYHYLLARAFEYRLLKAYPGSLLLDLATDELEKAAEANAEELSPEQVNRLMAPYQAQLSQITNLIIDEFAQRPPERQISRHVRLSAEECARLDRGEDLEINLATRSEFDQQDEANRRVVGIQVFQLDASGQGASMDIGARHSGLSAMTWDRKTYGFRHLGYDGQPFLYWKSTKDFQSGTIFSDKPSDAAASLLLSQLQIPNARFVLFSSPGLDAEFVISRPNPSDKKIADLVFSVEYSYTPI